MKIMQESAIAEAIKRQKADERYNGSGVRDFVATHENGYWCIRFSYVIWTGCELHLKRKGIKQFKSLNAVANCLKKMGVIEFKVALT